MADQAVIAVSESQRDRLKEACDRCNCSYKELMGEILSQINLESLDIEGNRYPQSGRQRTKRRTDEVKSLIEDNDAPDHIVEKAMELLENAYENEECLNKTPRVLASSCEYAARLYCNEKKTQEEISQDYDAGEQSIRKTYQNLVELYGIH